MARVTVISPKDGFVAKLLANDGAQLKTGDSVLVLDTDNEDLQIARLGALEELRSILAERLDDSVVNLNRQIAQLAADTARSLMQTSQHRVVQLMNGLQQGNTISPAELAQNVVSAYAQSDQKAQKQQEQLEKQITESRSINDLLKEHLALEIKAANARKDKATIKVPIDGHVNIHVTEGAFVKKGQFLFEVG